MRELKLFDRNGDLSNRHLLGVDEPPEPGPGAAAAASDAAATFRVRSVSDDPRLVLLGRAPPASDDVTGTGDARRIRAVSAAAGCPLRLGLPGQLASISGSDIGTDVPLLDTVDDASESGANVMDLCFRRF
jgi:hypothetical protein